MPFQQRDIIKVKLGTPNVEEDVHPFLISTTASKSKSDGLIGGKKVGKQAKYFLKNK